MAFDIKEKPTAALMLSPPIKKYRGKKCFPTYTSTLTDAKLAAGEMNSKDLVPNKMFHLSGYSVLSIS